MACYLYSLENTGTTIQNFEYSACSVSGCIVTAATQPNKIYYINTEDASLIQQGDVVPTLLQQTNNFLDFSGLCGGNFSFAVRDTTTGFTLNRFYCISDVRNCDTGTPIEYSRQCYQLVSSGVSSTYDEVDFVAKPSGSFTLSGECLSACQCNDCDTILCISNTGLDYDDNYVFDGFYNGEPYWTGQTYLIYYNTGDTRWCLSTVKGGTCLLFGKSPCTSSCPDFCDSYLSTEVCPTPTPTPTIDCDNLDFNAIFDCEVSPTPSITPTLTPTPSITPTVTPTNECGNFTIDVTISAYTPTPTVTPSITPTPQATVIRPFNFSGDVTFNTLDSSIQCANSKKFQDCYNGELYFTTDDLIITGNTNIQPFMIFKALVNGEIKCITYLDIDTQNIGTTNITLLEGPIGFSNLGDCVKCVPEVTKTPTPTPTPTNTQTPTTTSTQTPTTTSTQTPTQTPTTTQTPTMTPTNTPTMTPTQSQTVPCKCYALSDGTGNITTVSFTSCLGKTPYSFKQPPGGAYTYYICSDTLPIKTLGPGTITTVSSDCSDCCKCYKLVGNSVGFPATGSTYQYIDCTGNFVQVNVPKAASINVCASVFPKCISTDNNGLVIPPSGSSFPSCSGTPCS